MALAADNKRLCAHQTVRSDRRLVRQAEVPERNLEFRFNRPPWIEVDRDQKCIAPVGSAFRIVRYGSVESVEELEPAMAVERRIGAVDLVQPRVISALILPGRSSRCAK